MKPVRPRITQPRRAHPMITWMSDREFKRRYRINPYAMGVGLVAGFLLGLAILRHLFS